MNSKLKQVVATIAMSGIARLVGILAALLVVAVLWPLGLAVVEHLKAGKPTPHVTTSSTPTPTTPTPVPSPTATPCSSTMTSNDCSQLRFAEHEKALCTNAGGSFTATTDNSAPTCRVTTAEVDGPEMAFVATFGPDGRAQPNRCGDYHWLSMNGWDDTYRTDLGPADCNAPLLDSSQARADCQPKSADYFPPRMFSARTRFSWNDQLDICLPS